jgi:hypothetical protein
MRKAQKMKEDMHESNADPNIILGKVQRQMSTSLYHVICPHQLDQRRTENRDTDKGMFQGHPPHVQNVPAMMGILPRNHRDTKLNQLNRVVSPLQNGVSYLRKNDELRPQRYHATQEVRVIRSREVPKNINRKDELGP